MLNELFHEVVPVILNQDDLNAMYFSVENRSPFLDRRLFEASYSIPEKHLIQNGLKKSILRDAVKTIVPEQILKNPRKVGFNGPIEDLLDTKNKIMKEYLLDNSEIFELIDKNKVEVLLNKKKIYQQ